LGKVNNLNFLNNITKLASDWSGDNLSEKNMDTLEEFLINKNTKFGERIIAISILANIEDREKRDAILKRALENENSEEVINYIQNIFEKE